MSERQFKRNLIRLPEVLRKVPLSKPTIYRKMADGSFPKSRKIGERAVAWIEFEIDSWIESRIEVS